MKKINWIRKLTSRKLWGATATFVASLILAFYGDKETATEVTGIIMAGGAMIAYIVGEGLIDSKRVETENRNFDVE